MIDQKAIISYRDVPSNSRLHSLGFDVPNELLDYEKYFLYDDVFKSLYARFRYYRNSDDRKQQRDDAIKGCYRLAITIHNQLLVKSSQSSVINRDHFASIKRLYINSICMILLTPQHDTKIISNFGRDNKKIKFGFSLRRNNSILYDIDYLFTGVKQTLDVDDITRINNFSVCAFKTNENYGFTIIQVNAAQLFYYTETIQDTASV